MQSGLFKNETGPGMLQSSVQQTKVLQEFQRHKPCATDFVSFLFLPFELFADCMFAEGAGLGDSRPNLVFETRNNFFRNALLSEKFKTYRNAM